MLARFSAVLFTLIPLSDLTHGSEDKIEAKPDAISVPINESQRFFANNTSLTVGALLHAYMSNDPDQRRLSEMYILGVIDSLEGDSWCGYEIASPAAIQERLYVGLKNSADMPNERAATAIKSHFNKVLPCKDEQ